MVYFGSAQLWSLDAVDHKEMQVNHTDEILCLALTADNRFLVTGSKDSTLKMWELENGRLVQVHCHRLKSHPFIPFIEIIYFSFLIFYCGFEPL